MSINVKNLRTIVLKIGTTLLSGRLAFEGQVMEAVVKELCRLKHERDLNILIVSSGAVGCGMNVLGMSERAAALPVKQAVAAVGQATLVHYYETLFSMYGDGLHTAQVLLTSADLDNRKCYLNARNTLHALFDMKKVIPIVNENDTTAIEELRFGDNDTLAAKVAAKIGADLLIILSDVDGLFDKDPGRESSAKLIRQVPAVTPEIEALAGGAGSIMGSGGMHTKLEAAKIAAAAGVPVIIANGHRENVVHGVLSGETPCTTFAASEEALSHRKRWIAFGRSCSGKLYVDEGARRALTSQGKSLLAAGIIDVEGEFDVGDTIEIVSPEGEPVARGLANYSGRDIRRIKGCQSEAIAGILGQKDFDEVVHRDNLVLI